MVSSDSHRIDRLADLVKALRSPGSDSGDSRDELLARHEQESAVRGKAAESKVAGTTLGPFVLRGELGRGGMGVVYEAYDPELFRAVALKVLPAHLTLRPAMVERFRREALAVARLRHPNIVTIHRVDQDATSHFFAMELVAGAPLDRVVRHLKSHGRSAENFFTALGAAAPPSSTRYIDLCADLVAKVADALEHAHQAGVIHRDVKPSNILVRKDGSPVLTDFGLSLLDEHSDITRSGEFAGTPSYLSPEQALGARGAIDARSDVFSLGITLYELLTLEKPFDAETAQQVVQKLVTQEPRDPQRLRDDIPADLAAVVLKALEKDRERRYATAGAFAVDLRAFLAHLPVSARKATPLRRVRRFARREPVKATLVALLAVGVPALAGLGGFLLAKRTAIGVGEQEIAFEAREKMLADSLVGSLDDSRPPLEAIDAYLGTHPDDEEVLATKGWLMSRSKDANAGLAWLRGLGPRADLRLLRRLRAAYLRANSDVDGAAALEKDLGTPTSSFEWLLRGLGIAYLPPRTESRFVEALESFERAILESPRPRRFLFFTLSQFGLMARKAPDVARHAEAATRLWPKDLRAWTYAAWVHSEFDPDAAEQDFRAGIRLDPSNRELNTGLGRLLYEHSDPETAEAQIRVALELEPAEPQSNLRLCRILTKRRDVAGVKAQLQAWDQAARSDFRSAQVLAEFYMEDTLPKSLRSLEAAAAVAEQAVALSKREDSESLWTLASVRYHQKRYEDAQAAARAARRALQQNPVPDSIQAAREAFLERIQDLIEESESRPSRAPDSRGR